MTINNLNIFEVLSEKWLEVYLEWRNHMEYLKNITMRQPQETVTIMEE
jgi:hypothetical protein